MMVALAVVELVSSLLIRALIGVVAFKVSTLVGSILVLSYVTKLASAFLIVKQKHNLERKMLTELDDAYIKSVGGGKA